MSPYIPTTAPIFRYNDTHIIKPLHVSVIFGHLQGDIQYREKKMMAKCSRDVQ
jgi:hypothetical protein